MVSKPRSRRAALGSTLACPRSCTGRAVQPVGKAPGRRDTRDRALDRPAPRQVLPAQPEACGGPRRGHARDPGLAVFNNPSGVFRIDTLYASEVVLVDDVPALTVRGLALRSWRPFVGSGGTITVNQLWIYKRTGTFVLNNLIHGILTPPSFGTPVITQPVSVPVHNPQWATRRWDAWAVTIPFQTPVDVVAGEHLGVWIEFGVPQGTTASFDWVQDGPARYGSVRGDWTTSPPVVQGEALILGLIGGETQSVPLRLEAHGRPQLGETVLFQVRNAGAPCPQPANVSVVVGLSNPGVPVGTCRVLSSADLVTLGAVQASTMGDAAIPWAIPSDQGLLHQHLYVQAASTCGGVFSNGLRLTIGGVVQ